MPAAGAAPGATPAAYEDVLFDVPPFSPLCRTPRTLAFRTGGTYADGVGVWLQEPLGSAPGAGHLTATWFNLVSRRGGSVPMNIWYPQNPGVAPITGPSWAGELLLGAPFNAPAIITIRGTASTRDIRTGRTPLQRHWLELGDDEVAPTINESTRPDEVIWSSLWSVRPDARVHYELFRAGYETDLRWTLYVESPTPDDVLTRRMSKRISDLVFAKLRYTYGQ